MIILSEVGKVSPILLTLLLIGYLVLTELGDKKIKKTLLPFIIVLAVLFFILATIEIISKLK